MSERDRMVDLGFDIKGLAWQADALCCDADTALFFGAAGERPEARDRREAAAISICGRCPVMMECRDYARRNREHGVWGGESEMQRTMIGRGPEMPIGRVAKLAGFARDGMIAR